MLHRAGSWRPAGSTRTAAAAATLRPRSFVFQAVAAATVLLHAALIGWAWQGAVARHEPPRGARVALRLIAPAVRSPDAIRERPAARVERRISSGPRDLPQPTRLAPAPEKLEPVAAPPSSAEPIAGIALAMPTLSLPGAAPKRWVNPPPSPAAAPALPPAMLFAQAQALAAREAGRSQLDLALQQQLAEASPPSADAEGSCTLPAEPQAHLACNTDGLMQALGPRAAALSGLLLAYRSMEPRASGLAIAVVQGRYQVSWTMQIE